MKRRIVIIGGFAALLLTPERTPAQQPPAKIPRIGILTPADSDKTPIFDAFREGLRDLGYVEGRNVILEFRLAHGDFPRAAVGVGTGGSTGRWVSRRSQRSPRTPTAAPRPHVAA
jgi:putative ABC transport system substrate-binding protein